MGRARRSNLWGGITILLAVLLVGGSAEGRTIYVDDGPADFNNIQAAVDDANDGDTVLVADGVYTGIGNRNVLISNAITVRSENGATKCIIDCENSGRGLRLVDEWGDGAIVQGLTIQNGVAYDGGAIMCNEDCRLMIRNCILLGNEAEEHGGGIYFEDGSRGTVEDCVILGNLGAKGAAICCNNGSRVDVLRCRISGNSTWHEGGGIWWDDDTLMRIEHCEITGNIGYHGGGIFGEDSSRPVIANCTVASNSAIYGGGYYSLRSNPKIGNCIFSDNSPDQISGLASVLFSNVKNGYPGTGNIDADPCFADPGHWGHKDDPNVVVEPNDPNAIFVPGDYHVKSEGGRYDLSTQSWIYDDVTSPCIDAGNPLSPIGAEPFPNGGVVNMGAYGGTAEASKSYFGKPPCEVIVAGDVNEDCAVDFSDFRLMALHWCEDHNP